MLGVALLLQATLTIGVAGPATSPEYLPVRVAEAAGYFKEEQVSVTLQSFRSPTGVAEALAAGRVDLAATSLDAVLRSGHAHGVPPRLIFGLTAAPPVALVAASSTKGDLGEVADLEGKTVGITAPGTAEAEALSWLLTRAAVRPERVTEASFGERGLARAVAAGEVPAAILGDPWLTRLAREGQVTVLADLRKAGDAARVLKGDSVHAGVFLGPERRVEAADLERVARALLRATRRVQAAPPEELAALLRGSTVGELEDFALRLEGARNAFLAGGLVTDDALDGGLALVQARARLPAVLKLKPKAGLLLMEPLQQALRALSR